MSTIFGLNRDFVRNVAWQYVATATTVVVGFSYSMMTARWLGAAEYGLISLGTAFVSTVFQLLDFRINETVVRYFTDLWERNDRSRSVALIKAALLVNSLTCFVTGLVMTGLAVTIAARIVHDARGGMILLVCSAGIVVGSLGNSVALAILRVFGRFKLSAVVSVTALLAKFVLTAVALIWLSFGAVGVLAVGAFCSVCANSVLLFLAARELHERLGFQWPDAPLRSLRPMLNEMFRFARNNYLVSILSIPTKDLDVNLLGQFGSLEQVGTYRVAKNFMSAIWALSDPAFYVVYPELARFWSRRAFDSIRQFLKRLSFLAGVSGIGLFILAVTTVPTVINLTLGNEYGESGRIFTILCWGILVWMPLLWVNPLALAAGRSDISLKAGLMSAIVSVISYIILIPTFGVTGAAITNAFGGTLGVFGGLIMLSLNGILRAQQSGMLPSSRDVLSELHSEERPNLSKVFPRA